MNLVRFGVVEFALITRLDFIAPLEEADIAALSASNRIIEQYSRVMTRSAVKIWEMPGQERRQAMKGVWKLGLYYIHGVLFGADPFLFVDNNL